MDSLCEKMQDQLADHILGILSPQEIDTVNEHVGECRECEQYMQALRNENRILVRTGEDIQATMKAGQDRVIEALGRSAPTAYESELPTWRMIMKSRTIRFATAAVVVIAAALTVHYLGGSPDGTSVTFAQVMDQIREIRPYAYTQTTRYHHTNKTVVRRFMILNRHQRREEFPDGTVRIFDHSKEPVGMLQLNPDTRRALWKTYPDQQATPINTDTLETLRRFEERPDIYRVEDRGVQEMDGHKTKCFHVPGENNVYAVCALIAAECTLGSACDLRCSEYT